MFMIQEPGGKTDYKTLSKAKKDGVLELVSINDVEGSVIVKNAGEAMTMTFESHGMKPTGPDKRRPWRGAGSIGGGAGLGRARDSPVACRVRQLKEYRRLQPQQGQPGAFRWVSRRRTSDSAASITGVALGFDPRSGADGGSCAGNDPLD